MPELELYTILLFLSKAHLRQASAFTYVPIENRQKNGSNPGKRWNYKVGKGSCQKIRLVNFFSLHHSSNN